MPAFGNTGILSMLAAIQHSEREPSSAETGGSFLVGGGPAAVLGFQGLLATETVLGCAFDQNGHIVPDGAVTKGGVLVAHDLLNLGSGGVRELLDESVDNSRNSLRFILFSHWPSVSGEGLPRQCCSGSQGRGHSYTAGFP